MEQLTIRKATIEDLELIQKLNHELCLKESVEYDSTLDPNFPFTDIGKEYFTSAIKSSDSCVLVAVNEVGIIGYLAGAIAESESYRLPTKLAELENMYIEEALRGQGIGGKLYEEFEKWCKEKEVKRIRVIASEANVRALEFYRNRDLRGVDLILEKELV